METNVKNYIFIGWSNNQELAIELKKLIDETDSCAVVGGDFSGNPTKFSDFNTINETIEYQMSHCNQFIILLQKKNNQYHNNEEISDNLFYEIGFIRAQNKRLYPETKINVFYIDMEIRSEELLPTDIKGVWMSPIESKGRSNQDLAKEIFDAFMKENNKTKHRITNKFSLLNNSHLIENELHNHFKSPSMSDYDLAQLILVYLQSAFCYQEQELILSQMKSFSGILDETPDVYRGLKWAVRFAVNSLKLFCTIVPNDDGTNTVMKFGEFYELRKNYLGILKEIIRCVRGNDGEEDASVFLIDEEVMKNHYLEGLLIAHIQEHITFLIIAFLFGEDTKEDKRIELSRRGLQYGQSAVDNLTFIAKNEKDEMFSKLLLSYLYKNMAFFSELNNDEEKKNEYINSSFALREEMYDHVKSKDKINPSLFDYIGLEYFSQLVDVVRISEDDMEREYHMECMGEYIAKRNTARRRRDFMLEQLIAEYKKLKNPPLENAPSEQYAENTLSDAAQEQPESGTTESFAPYFN